MKYFLSLFLLISLVSCTKKELIYPKIIPSEYDSLIINNFQTIQKATPIILDLNLNENDTIFF